MKIKAEKKVLLDAILPPLLSLSTKAIIPALECLYLRAENGMLIVTGYDLSKGIKTETSVHVEEEGAVLLNAGKISSIIRSMPEGMIEFSVNDNFLTTISGGKSKFEIAGLSADGYPSIPELVGDRFFEIRKCELKRICQQVLFSISYEAKNPVLSGICFEIIKDKLTAVSCDAFRLSIRREVVKCDELMKFIVPGKTVADLVKLLDDSDDFIKVELTDKHIIIHFDDLFFFSRLLEGDYIDYMKSIPKETKIDITVDTADFINCLERVQLVIDERAKSPVKIIVNPDGITVECSTVNGKIEEEICADVEGEELTIGFNNRYLLDALKGVLISGDTKVVLRLTSSLVGMSIQPLDHDEYYYLVLPVRLN